MHWKIIIPIYLIGCLLFIGCREQEKENSWDYVGTKPRYDSIQICAASDTLNFILDENMYNNIKSFTLFTQNGSQYIAFHDKRAEALYFYDFRTRHVIKKLTFKQLLPNRQFHKTSFYVKNFDSIFITNSNKIYRVDSTGKKRASIKFLEHPPLAWANLGGTNPPFIKGPFLYTGVHPYVNETSLKALKEWKVLYQFDFKSGKAKLVHPLPELYRTNIYGYQLLHYSYCINDQGYLIFSFSADSTLYKTNLSDYYKQYYAKSKFQKGNIRPVSKEEIATDTFARSYLIRDSYGAIYFDAHEKRYLRIAQRGISEADYVAKKWAKEQSILIFDQDLRVIGESSVNTNILLNYMFITPEGQIYARTNIEDENAIHFIRLGYSDKREKIQLAKNENSMQ